MLEAISIVCTRRRDLRLPNGNRPVARRQFSAHAAACQMDRGRECLEAACLVALSFSAGTFLVTKKIRCHQHMRWRRLLPVLEQIVYVPHGERVNFAERPPGGSGDVAVDQRPLRDTARGVGSPADAVFEPDTSSIAPKSALKSSNVRPFSSCSCERS